MQGQHECKTNKKFYLVLEKQQINIYFSLKIPCEENKCCENFKIMRKMLFYF